MKTKLIACLYLIILPMLMVAQEQESWWQQDGSLKVENAEYTFRSSIVPPRKGIQDSEMVLVNFKNYHGEEQNISYGINSKDLSSNERTKLKVYHRSKENINFGPNYGFDFTDDNYLIYGCQTKSNYITSFQNQEQPWDAFGYYAHGYSFSKTQIKSIDYNHLWNRPKSASWFYTFIELLGAVLVIVAIVVSGGIALGFIEAGGVVVSTIISYATVKTFIVLSGLAVFTMVSLPSYYHIPDVNTILIPQTEFETDMELVVPNKISNPSDQDQKNWNKNVDKHLTHAFDCSDFPDKKCYKASFREIVVELQVKDAHVVHVNIPGELQKNTTPYQLFKNYRYITDKTGYVVASAIIHEDIKEASEFFDSKAQILPRKIMSVPHQTTVDIKLENYEGIPTYYVVSKDVPSMDEIFYVDLGVYGHKDGHEYRLYRFQINADHNEHISFQTGPEGPYLAGDNIRTVNSADLMVSVYRSDDVIPVIEEGYSFTNNSKPQINFKAGDSVVFTSKHADFSLTGIPEIWLARAAGESKYYCTPSVQPDEYKPFLGYDSQVHGVAVRKHPTPNHKKTPSIINNGDGTYSWYWIAQRRMSSKIRDITRQTSQNVAMQKYKTAQNLGATSFPIGGGNTVTKQRNNQREGINMQLLYAWKKENEARPTFNTYEGPDFILGTDPDEIIYLGSNGAKIPSDVTPIPQALLKIDVEEWKRLPEGEESDPINEMVTAYQQNRGYVVGGNLYTTDPYNGYEILDKGNYSLYSIPGVTNQKPCNGKPCVKFIRNGLGTSDDNVKAPGEFSFKANRETPLNIPVSLSSPQKIDSGFYGSIEGDQWPSEWQKHVPYSFTGLSGLSEDVLNTLVMEYTHESDIGILTRETRYFRNGGRVENGKWTEHFDLKGWGYNEITVYVQRKPGATMVPIAGFEILEVMIRFVSAPGSKWKDFSPTEFGGLDLKEARGEGNYWYLRDSNEDPSDSPEYGKPIDDINKAYTLSLGDRIVFTAMDSDPHTFFHYDVEWYLSERFMAKRLFPDDLENRIQWFLAPIDYDGLGTYLHTGRWLEMKELVNPGKYRLTAVYGDQFDKNNDIYGNTRMSHNITVLPTNYENDVSADKGNIDIHPLSPDQINWMQKSHPNVDATWRVAEVDDIYSQWTHIDGPRAIPPNNKPNRYGLENDYNAHFDWFNSTMPQLRNSGLTKLTIEDPNLDWFPSNWIRHYSGDTLPDDMNVSLVTNGITSDIEGIDQALATAFPITTVPEVWQWRLPWVSTTNWQGYRTRNNIKVVFNMSELFDNSMGAFSGLGNTNYAYPEDYAAVVSNSLPELTDQRKSMYDFYLDLLSGRKYVFDPSHENPANFKVTQVDDVGESNDIVIVNSNATQTNGSTFLMGADMSIVHSLKDQGINWTKSGDVVDPYKILADAGANVARFRLWVDPKKTDGDQYFYGRISEVLSQIKKAKSNGLQTILNLHLSDTWADPKQQIIPAKWNEPSFNSNRLKILKNEIEDYIVFVFSHLQNNMALPDIVQIGNEINGNILMTKPYNELTLNEVAKEIGVTPEQLGGNKYKINWDRNAVLINAALNKVKSKYGTVKTMLHVAGPLDAQHWFAAAFGSDMRNRLGTRLVDKDKVDILAMSYYPGEEAQQQSKAVVKQVIESLGTLYDKDVLIVETAFPKTYGWSDQTTNLYGESNRGKWPENTSAEKQLEWLISLREVLLTTRRSIGFVYWEPFWVGSNTVRTKDFIGSNWENMSFFSFTNGVPTASNPLEMEGGINVFGNHGSVRVRRDTQNELNCNIEYDLPYRTSFEADFGGWSHGASNNFDWSRRIGRTPSVSTGPFHAKDGGYYLYTEASYPNNPSKTAVLLSPCFDLTKKGSFPSFSFNYHMYGGGMGTLKLEVTTNDEDWTTLWSKADNQGNNWFEASVDLSNFVGSLIKLRFTATTGAIGNSWQGDIAIDDLYLNDQNSFHFRKSDVDKEIQSSSDKFSAKLNEEFQVYPNPTSDELTISFPNDNSKSYTVLLMGLQGKVLYRKSVNGIDTHTISTKKLRLNSGSFIIQVVSEKGKSTKTVIIK